MGLSRHRPRLALSMIEVMVSMAVLAIALAGTLEAVSGLSTARRSAPDVATAHQVLYGLVERIQGARWEVLGSPDAPWSLPRFADLADTATGNRPAMTDTAADPSDTLSGCSLLDRPSGVNLSIRVEYYRALTPRDANGALVTATPGMMDGEDVTYAKPADFRAVLRSASGRARYRLDPAAGWPTTQVGENEPVIVRVIATYEVPGGGVQTIDLVTGRKR